MTVSRLVASEGPSLTDPLVLGFGGVALLLTLGLLAALSPTAALELQGNVVWSFVNCPSDHCTLYVVEAPEDLAIDTVRIRVQQGETSILPIQHLVRGEDILTSTAVSLRYLEQGTDGRVTRGDAILISGLEPDVPYVITLDDGRAPLGTPVHHCGGPMPGEPARREFTSSFSPPAPPTDSPSTDPLSAER